MSTELKEDSLMDAISVLNVLQTATLKSDSPLGVAAIITQLKENEEHKDKKFKISSSDNCVIVKRVV